MTGACAKWSVLLSAWPFLPLCGCIPASRGNEPIAQTEERRLLHVEATELMEPDPRTPETGSMRTASLAAHKRWCEVDLAPLPPRASSATRRMRRAPLPGFWETVHRDLVDWPGTFWEDTRSVYTQPAGLLILGGAYGASLTLQATDVDDTVERSFRSHSTFKEDWREALGAMGNPGVHFGVAGLFYLVGQQQQEERTYNVGTKLFRALAVTGVSTFIGKAATWDDVPNGEWGAFPSGHTASTFALASVLHEEYGPWAGIPLYGLGALVAYERLEDEEHYFSDVVMGGVLGLVVGHTVARDGEPIELFGGQLVPFVDPTTSATGLAWVKGIE